MEIEFTDEAYENLDLIEDYLLYKWNDKVLENFNFKLSKCLEMITGGLVIFQKYENTNYHKVLITKHNTLIYEVKNDVLIIHRILQNIQDPTENLKYFDDED